MTWGKDTMEQEWRLEKTKQTNKKNKNVKKMGSDDDMGEKSKKD